MKRSVSPHNVSDDEARRAYKTYTKARAAAKRAYIKALSKPLPKKLVVAFAKAAISQKA